MRNQRRIARARGPLREDHRVGAGEVRRERFRGRCHMAMESHSPANSKTKRLPNARRTPALLRGPPVDAGQKITELRRRDRHRAVGRARPDEPPPLQPFVPHERMQPRPAQISRQCGLRIRFILYSHGSCHVSGGATTGMANAFCCRPTTAPFGQFLRNGLIL
jgi:hypothetical protein